MRIYYVIRGRGPDGERRYFTLGGRGWPIEQVWTADIDHAKEFPSIEEAERTIEQLTFEEEAAGAVSAVTGREIVEYSKRSTTVFVNLTPHAVKLIPYEIGSADSPYIVVPPSGVVARIDSVPGAKVITEGCEGFPAGVAIHDRTTYGAPVGLPDPKPGVTYIVSALFAGRVGDRIDVVYPGTGPHDGCVRLPNGQVDGVTRLIRA